MPLYLKKVVKILMDRLRQRSLQLHGASNMLKGCAFKIPVSMRQAVETF